MNTICSFFELSVSDFVVVARYPDRPNIFLNVVHQKRYDVEKDFDEIMMGVKLAGLGYPKTIIYTNTIRDATQIFQVISRKIGNSHLYNGPKPDPKLRLTSMYHGHLTPSYQKLVTDEFSKSTSTIRVLICTVAFGMGVDIKDIRNVIHYGRVESILCLWQEIGRGGRDGESCQASWYPTSTVGNDSKTMEVLKKTTTVCIRTTILASFSLPQMNTEVTRACAPCTAEPNCNKCCCALCACCNHCRAKCRCYIYSQRSE